MKKQFFICLLTLSFFTAFAAKHPLPHIFTFQHFAIPVRYAITSKDKVLYIPSSCSGMINDAVAAEGEMGVSVLGTIYKGRLSVQVKVTYKGKAETTVEGLTYQVNGNMVASKKTIIESEPVDVFIKGSFKLQGKNKDTRLYVSDIGYITVYPDGTVANHLFDPRNNPDYSRPKVYCTEPKE